MGSSVPRISVRNLQRKVRFDTGDLARFAERALQLCLRMPAKHQTDLKKLAEILVLIVSDRRIALLNRQFLDESGPTDVITFQHGEVFISGETARRQARQFRTTLKRELRLYLVHGLLHLHGFNDRTAAGARKMEQIQKKILSAAQKGGAIDPNRPRAVR
jgi:probable rRNA maturation factor